MNIREIIAKEHRIIKAGKSMVSLAFELADAEIDNSWTGLNNEQKRQAKRNLKHVSSKWNAGLFRGEGGVLHIFTTDWELQDGEVRFTSPEIYVAVGSEG